MEKISLYKSDKIKLSASDRNLMLYAFPEIPCESEAVKNDNPDGNCNFARSSFYENHSTLADDSTEPNTNKAAFGRLTQHRENKSKQAFLQGYKEGQKAGSESERQNFVGLLTNCHQLLCELKNIKSDIYMNSEREIVSLVLAIARKIVGHAADTQKGVVVNVVKEALKNIMDHDKVNIKVNPLDLENLKLTNSQFSDFIEKTNGITFEEDESISIGGCFIETNLGDIDARLENQLQVIEDLFKSEFLMSGHKR